MMKCLPYAPTQAEMMGAELVRRSGVRPRCSMFVFRNGKIALRCLDDETIKFVDGCTPEQYAQAVNDVFYYHLRRSGPFDGRTPVTSSIK